MYYLMAGVKTAGLSAIGIAALRPGCIPVIY